jgi:hypothetical protein
VFELKDRVYLPIRIVLPKSQEIRVLCEAVTLRDIDLPSGFLERVTDAFPGLGSQGGGVGQLALIARISKTTNR